MSAESALHASWKVVACILEKVLERIFVKLMSLAAGKLIAHLSTAPNVHFSYRSFLLSEAARAVLRKPDETLHWLLETPLCTWIWDALNPGLLFLQE